MKRLLAALFLCLWASFASAQQINTTGVASNVGTNSIKLVGIVAANSGAVIPINGYIQQIIIVNTTANAITGGLKFGTSAGATDVAAAVAVGANAITFITDALLLKRWFSASAAQTIFFDTVTLWNSASVNVTIVWGQL